jgi:hypothetical protein
VPFWLQEAAGLSALSPLTELWGFCLHQEAQSGEFPQLKGHLWPTRRRNSGLLVTTGRRARNPPARRAGRARWWVLSLFQRIANGGAALPRGSRDARQARGRPW